MLIVRGVNVFPSAVREVVSAFAPRGQRPHPRQAAGARRQAGAAAARERRARARRDGRRRRSPRRSVSRLRNVLVVQTRVELVPWGSLRRSEYKSKLVDARRGNPWPRYTLNILKPSVNNLSVRVFVRAAGLDFEEVDVWGKTTTPEFLAKYPAHLTPMIEEAGCRAASLWRELRDHAVPLQQARPRRASIRPIRASARWSTARCST